jgi:hypothetical protein
MQTRRTRMLNFWRKAYEIVSRRVLENRDVRHSQASLIYSSEDVKPNDFLIELSTQAIRR